MGKDLERALWRMYAPHKVKLAVSGCPRNCAEAGIKDVGVIGVESGWEIYVAGNGGIKTEVAQFLVKVKTARRGARVRRRVPAALSRGRLVSRAHRALRRARRPRLRASSAIVDDAAGRSALWERLQFALDGEPDPWHEPAKAASTRQFDPDRPRRLRRPRMRRSRQPTMDGSGPLSAPRIRGLRARPTSRGSARASSRAAADARGNDRACSAPPTIASSRSPTAARTRAARCRRASCYGDRVACPLHNWTIDLDTGCAVAPDEGCVRALSGARRGRAGVSCDASLAGADGASRVAHRWRETRSTCCYCGVGCGVRHRARRRGASPACAAIPTTRRISASCAPRAATLHLTARPARSDVRALHPELRRAPAARPRERVELGRDARHARRPLRRDASATHGPDSVAFYVSGQLLTEDYYVFNKLAQRRRRHQQHRHQLAAVHVARGRRLQGDARRRRAAVLLRGHRSRRPRLHRRLEHGAGRIRCCSAASRRRARATRRMKRRSSSIRAAPTTAARRRPASRDRAGHRRRAVPRHAARAAVGRAASTTRYIARAHRGLRRAEGDSCASTRRRAPREICGIAERRPRARAARWFGEAGAALSLYCQGLNQSTSGTAKNAALDQPASRDRPDRPARRRAVQPHRPAERDGRARGRRAGQPAARRIATLADPAHRAEIARAVGRRRAARRSPARPRSRCSTRCAAGDDQDGLDRLHESRAVAAGPGTRCARRSRAPSSSCCRKRTPTPRRRATPTCCCPRRRWGEKDGTVTNSERRISRVRAAVPPPGRGAADWEIAADFARRLDARLRPGAARRCFAFASAAGMHATEHRATTRGRDLDITGLSYATPRRARPAAVAVPRRRDRPAGAAVRGRRVSDGRRTRALRRVALPTTGRTRRCALSDPPQHRTAARPVARHEPHRHASPSYSATRPSRGSRCTPVDLRAPRAAPRAISPSSSRGAAA